MDDFSGNKSSFWPSYVDIMTTLFAIMLVLFCVTFTHFKITNGQLKRAQDSLNVYVRDYKELLSIYKIVENIDTAYFEFKKKYVKHIFKINVTYQTGEFRLDKLSADEKNPQEAQRLRDEIFRAGQVIKQTIENLQKKEDLKQDIKYLVVIEGQASKDGYYVDEFKNNNVLSYQRAWKLTEFWKSRGIDFTQMDKCELLISGSGEKGVPREQENERYNKRFLIHIVPVIGNLSRKNMVQTIGSDYSKEKEVQELQNETYANNNSREFSNVYEETLLENIKIYHLRYNKIDLVCGKMPQPSDSSVIFCAEAAYTAQCLNQFNHSNINGDHVSGGTRFRGTSCKNNTGAFVYYNNRFKFLHDSYSNELDSAAYYGGMGFGQELLIHHGDIIAPVRKDTTGIYRCLCAIDNQLCIAECIKPMRINAFVEYLIKINTTDAIYLDMGTGWDYSWWRDDNNQVHYIHDKQIPYTTNWITFYK